MDGGGPQGGGKAPLEKKHLGGRRLKGRSTPEMLRVLEPFRTHVPKDGASPGSAYTLESKTLVSLAVELGLQWHELSHPNPHHNQTVVPRSPSDAEILYLQMPGQVPLCFYAPVFGAAAPSLFWTDLAAELPSSTRPLSPASLEKRLKDWWKALHLCRDDAGAAEILGEPVDIVVHGKSPSDRDYELTIPTRSLGSIFTWAPRSVVIQPEAEFNQDQGHRIISGFGVKDVMYFHAFHLLGRRSMKYYSPDKLTPGP